MGTAINQETRQGPRAGVQSRGERRPRTRSELARARNPRNGGEQKAEGLANALGWFSIGLGVAQIVAPGRVARLVGVGDSGRSREIMRTIGLREIAAGVGILSQSRSAGWLWARVAGDAMDLALLGKAMTASGGRQRASAATAAVLGVTALDVYAAERMSRTSTNGEEQTVDVARAVTVNRPVEEVYEFWRNFENLPRFMKHLESVQDLGGGRSRWKARGPAGTTVEWEAEVLEDVPNERISWHSVEGSEVWNEGTVLFREAPGGRGTEVVVVISYDPPAGKLGQIFAKLFREEPGQQVFDDLRAFKQVMETGEIVVSDATLRRGLHPAHPPGKLGARVSS
ncbi:MAG TPA: SRPBCC family protein [Gemmatimonadaceae bacterium]|nr:SRPBCC family protein [Gemmatimonadaceae bacterium]